MQRRKAGIIAVATFLLFLLSPYLYAEPVLNINNRTDHYLLSNILQYFVDTDANKTLDEVLENSDAWQTSNSDTINRFK